ncbi:hypothetical protein ANN_04114 [Periplaneta americana]|uniref:Uncharacterized protein n=1 Tax=Periplaneta americana TaxID=6978 RepID=A0ABQ8T7N9_PERAM|nr:hypothetical protein ANN_04114 [Periplaneta americana]
MYNSRTLRYVTLVVSAASDDDDDDDDDDKWLKCYEPYGLLVTTYHSVCRNIGRTTVETVNQSFTTGQPVTSKSVSPLRAELVEHVREGLRYFTLAQTALFVSLSGLSANDDSGYNCSANDRSAFYRYKTASIDYSRICNRRELAKSHGGWKSNTVAEGSYGLARSMWISVPRKKSILSRLRTSHNIRNIAEEGLLLMDIMPHGTTINSDAYVATLKKRQARLIRVRRHREKQDVLLLHDNAQPYVSHKTTDQIRKFG